MYLPSNGSFMYLGINGKYIFFFLLALLTPDIYIFILSIGSARKKKMNKAKDRKINIKKPIGIKRKESVTILLNFRERGIPKFQEYNATHKED